MARLTLERLLDDSSRSLRELVLVLYAVVTPVFGLVLWVLQGTVWPLPWSVLAELVLCSLAMVLVAVVREPNQYLWIYPGALAPVLSCGVAAVALDERGLVFLAVLTAPLAWAGILFEAPTVLAAWLSSSVVCFSVLWNKSDLVSALLGTAVFLVIEGLVGWVVHGKSLGLGAARLENLDRHVNDIELTMTFEGQLVHVNDRAVAAYGYTQAELLRLTIHDLLVDPDSEEFHPQLTSAHKGPDEVFVTLHRRRDGTVFPVEVSSRPFLFRGQGYLHSLVRDITARKAEESKLRDLYAEVSRQNALKKRLISILAHDLRGPVGQVASTLDPVLLKSNFTDDQIFGEILPGLKASADSAYNLLEGLLEWIKGSLEGLRVKNEVLRVVEVVDPVFGWLGAQAGAKGVSLVRGGGGELGLVADRVMTQTILRNLVSNAVKFSPYGAEVRVEAELVGKDEAWPVIRVIDRGQGIEEGTLSLLFDLAPEKVREGTGGEVGSGLGLMFCKDMADAMGARLEVESRPGYGSVFSLLFPPTLNP